MKQNDLSANIQWNGLRIIVYIKLYNATCFSRRKLYFSSKYLLVSMFVQMTFLYVLRFWDLLKKLIIKMHTFHYATQT